MGKPEIEQIKVAGTTCLKVESGEPGIELFMSAPNGESMLQVLRHNVVEKRFECALFYRPASGALRFSCVGRGVGPTAVAAERAMQRSMARKISRAA